jgi:hypothetical protein
VERIIRERLLFGTECPVICRDFCLEEDKIQQVQNSKVAEEIFLARMVRWKCRVLNELAGSYDKVIFYDDMADRYKHAELAGNVEVRLPVHMGGI